MSDKYGKRERKILDRYLYCLQNLQQWYHYRLQDLERDKQEALRLLHQGQARATTPVLVKTKWGVLFA